MRIVQIEDFFHPNAGYQLNILSKFFSLAGNEVFIVTAELAKMPEGLTVFFGKDNIEKYDRMYESKYSVKIVRVPVKKYISGRVWFDSGIFQIVDELQPEVLYVHGNDTLIAIQFFLRINKLKYPIISDSHMLEMASQNKFRMIFRLFYKNIIAPIIIKNKIPVIRTVDDTYVEKCLGIPLSNCPVISFGSDTTIFHPSKEAKHKFREKYGINENAFVVIYAGKLDEAKGGLLLAETFKSKISQKRDVVIVVVGNTVGSYGEKVEATFRKSENRIIRFPSQQHADLPQFYQMADIAVFARQCSLSFFDVQACGLPVVVEDNDINIDRCSNGNGKCFSAGNVESFREMVKTFVEMPDVAFREFTNNSLSYIYNGYDYKTKADEYLKIIKSAYEHYYENEKF